VEGIKLSLVNFKLFKRKILIFLPFINADVSHLYRSLFLEMLHRGGDDKPFSLKINLARELMILLI